MAKRKAHPVVKAIQSHMKKWKKTGKIAGKPVATTAGAMRAAASAARSGKK